jgi:hypothetical protein
MFLVVVVCATALLQNAYGDPIVYDYSTPTHGAKLPEGFYPFDYYSANEPAGNEITLAGTDRYMTGFDLILSSVSSTQPTILSSLKLEFCQNDGYDAYGYYGAPGDVIPSLTTTLTNVSVEGITRVHFAFAPTLMPDDFTWIVVADSSNAGLATCSKSVGTCGDYYWDYYNAADQWYALNFASDPPSTFGAVVYAVPEPMTLSIMGLAGGLMVLKRNRRSRMTNVK